jgi:RNA polymerase sigma-70 factor (ECF subfamily)
MRKPWSGTEDVRYTPSFNKMTRQSVIGPARLPGYASAMSAAPTDFDLARRLRSGDERAMRVLVERYHGAMVNLAKLYARNRASAEEIVQDSWVAVIEGIGRFEGRSSLKTWLFAIVANKARSRAQRDGLIVLLDDMAPGADLDPARFDERGHWTQPPGQWDTLSPERLAGDREVLKHIGAALDALPPAQRAVVLLRDVEGLDPDEICNVLGVSESNLRVLLHRARTRLRAALETLLTPVAERRKS